MKKVFIIGGGIVGAMVARRCHSLGYSVSVLDNFQRAHESASKLACAVWRDTWYKGSTMYEKAFAALSETRIQFHHIDSHIITKHHDTIKRSLQKSYQVDNLSDITLYENPERFCDEVINGEVTEITSYNGKTKITYKDIRSQKSLELYLTDTTVYVCAGHKTPELLNVPLSNYTTTNGVAAIHDGIIVSKDKPSIITNNGKQYTYIYNIQPHKNAVVRQTIINGKNKIIVRLPWEAKGNEADKLKYNAFIKYFYEYTEYAQKHEKYELKYGTRLHSKTDEFIIKINENLIGICGTGKDTLLLSSIIIKDLIK